MTLVFYTLLTDSVLHDFSVIYLLIYFYLKLLKFLTMKVVVLA